MTGRSAFDFKLTLIIVGGYLTPNTKKKQPSLFPGQKFLLWLIVMEIHFFRISKITCQAFIVACLLLQLGGTALAQDITASEPTALFEYAQRLQDEGDLFRAEGELKRFIYFHPKHARIAEARALLKKIQAQLEEQKKAEKQTSGSAGSAAVGFYQSHLRTFRSPDSSCPSYPNCSSYAMQAMDKHGTMLGSFIYVDRFWREATTVGKPPYIYHNGKKLHYDPLEANDYWLNRVKGGAHE
jgi:putative component of membrane protein insertase Oxa1/YidC/SpoIIIJ protein YidD